MPARTAVASSRASCSRPASSACGRAGTRACRAPCSCWGACPRIRPRRAGHLAGMPERPRSSRLTVRDAARAVPEDFGRALEAADERLRRTLRRTPLLDNLADWRLVLLAGAAGL